MPRIVKGRRWAQVIDTVVVLVLLTATCAAGVALALFLADQHERDQWSRSPAILQQSR